ncbi:hypothetical protein BDV95DRAFT_590652 [Massariosphaeria phaeospora]|uniref:Carrier domain-containing protein n=1 Tax=Massariosphaeria phaeospora TaxID=100035 RepID=A0A7C8MEY0_9PLEO|nr:hypothetical protein BDV95DRAFT_590652 [Massariosphaeria phaeospora]
MDPNYFVCTLGQAAALSHGTKPYRTINDLLTYQAEHLGELPAVGFPVPSQNRGQWGSYLFTFRDVHRGAEAVAERLRERCRAMGPAPQTVALLCHSSLELLFTWLALMLQGHSVLLVAPQCQPAAIAHLCKSCQVRLLLHDSSHYDRSSQAARLLHEENEVLVSQAIPLQDDQDMIQLVQRTPASHGKTPPVDELAVAYLHHTSGTSTGLPKPIPQTHRAAVGVLPHLPQTPSKASFTTTPLYHGGIADLLRSWTSDSLIWLFPGRDAPITARNICRCLDVANTASTIHQHPQTRYFSSVPYILQMMEAHEQGLELLRRMDIVGVGGAALPSEVGDRLVTQGVNLLSRFGSAECGFLLSSYRDRSDTEWQYLRNYNPAQLLQFEAQEDGLSELVINPGWPHMAKTNRPDQSFATADLFAPHPSIANAWRYHSRADSQLTLLTGKKFDPAPLEAAIATSSLLDDVLVFGNGRLFPGALLLRSKQAQAISDEELLRAIRPAIERLNEGSQDHARIPLNMVIPMPHQSEGLPKSSKGTMIRNAAQSRFDESIDGAYGSHETEAEYVKDDDLPHHLTGLIQSVVSKPSGLDWDTDLFSYGVDSVACMQLRKGLRQLIRDTKQELPLSIVEDCGTIHGLSNYIVRHRHGAIVDVEDEKQLMLDLVEEYSVFQKQGSSSGTPQIAAMEQLQTSLSGQVVVLTGATGALGAHILDLLRNSDDNFTIYCLVRGSDAYSSRERVSKALEQRGLTGLSSMNHLNGKIKVLQAQLGDNMLGLDEATYNYLAAETDLIIHVGWMVNFRLKLRSFVKDNIAGVKNLINLALSSPRDNPPRLTYCSSTAAIMEAKLDVQELPERTLQDPEFASPLGYSRSKWVAEQICLNAHQATALKGRIGVVRVGQLSGDSGSGIWNTKEAWPMMLSTARLIGCLPDLQDEPLDWLPVDVAAEAFFQASQDQTLEGDRMTVCHVLNPHRQPTWHSMLQWLKKKADFEILPPDVWVRRLEHTENTEHSALKLLGLWKGVYCNGTQERKPRPQFSMVETKMRVPALRVIQPIHEAYMGKVWAWIEQNVD